jgi:hypothetical protein
MHELQPLALTAAWKLSTPGRALASALCAVVTVASGLPVAPFCLPGFLIRFSSSGKLNVERWTLSVRFIHPAFLRSCFPY